MADTDRCRLSWESLRDFLRLSSPEQLIEVFLLSADDADTWSVLRDILLVMQLKVPKTEAFQPKSEALERLYLLTRFVEIHERFPNQEEEGLLFQHKTALVTMTEILRKRMSSVRERLMRRLDLKAKWRGSIGIGLVRYPREGPEPWNEERSKNRTSDEEQSPGDEYFP
jgi:hypothetical protein